MTNPESIPVNPLEFPIEYFGAQVYFAHKWSEVSGEDFGTTLLTKTALCRRITGSVSPTDEVLDEWNSLAASFGQVTDTHAVTQLLYQAYRENPKSVYVQPTHPGAFGYDYLAEDRTVKLHFTNPHRGERPLSDENMGERRQEFRALLKNVRQEHPEAALLMSATWLRSTSHYQSLSPPDIDTPKDLMSADMKFAGNSVWGQFVDAFGNVNRRVYDQFIGSVDVATNLGELIAAFPYKTLQALDPIDKYYNYYKIEDSESESPK